METIVWEWVNFMLRWLHVITAIAWIGSSFYFVHLDASLRRREGLPEMRFEWDAVRAIITRFDAAQQTDLANVIQAYFGDFMTTYRQELTAMVGQAGEQVNGIYEADYREFNRDTYVRGRETFDRTWAEVKELILGAWWRDLQMEQAEQEKADG